MRLCGMEVFVLRSPFHTVGKRRSCFFFVCLFFPLSVVALFVFFTFGHKNPSLGWEPSSIHTPSEPSLVASSISAKSLYILSTGASNLHCVNNMKNGSAEDSGIHLSFGVFVCVFVFIDSVCMFRVFSCCSLKGFEQRAPRKGSSIWWGCVHVLVWQGAKGTCELSWLSLKVPRAGGGLRALGGRRLQREGERDRRGENRDG